MNGPAAASGAGSIARREHLLEARRHFGERIRVQPFAPNPKAGYDMRANDRFAGGELDEFLSLAMIEPVGTGVGIEDPILLDAMLLVRGELGPDIAIRRPRRKGLHYQSRGKGRMASRQSADLLGREVGEVWEEHIARAEPDGDDLAMHFADPFVLHVQIHQMMQEIEQARVPEVDL